VALDRPQWLADLSRGFKRHRQGRTGWTVEVMRDRLRVVSGELPARPGESPDAPPKRRAVTLTTPPGPATAAAALQECCRLFDLVMAGSWNWPDPEGLPGADDPLRLSPAALQKLAERLKAALVGEKIGLDTWHRTYRAYLARLVEVAGQQAWRDDRALLEAVLQSWPPGTRARQMAFDRLRRLWREAGWPWANELQSLRGNGKAAADPEGVRAFTDAEIQELRARLQRSRRLTDADRVAWDCLICFGLRPKELQGLQLDQADGLLVARVTRSKRSSKGAAGARSVPAVPPAGWPADCYGLLDRWKRHGLPEGMVAARSPGEVMAQQLSRLQIQTPVAIELPKELTPYGLRHAFALRLGQQLGLHVRESAELMGHSPTVHLQTYGRRLDQPGLLAKVRRLQAGSGNSSQQ
jgi:integrase